MDSIAVTKRTSPSTRAEKPVIGRRSRHADRIDKPLRGVLMTGQPDLDRLPLARGHHAEAATGYSPGTRAVTDL
jgi:hypothetical protein